MNPINPISLEDYLKSSPEEIARKVQDSNYRSPKSKRRFTVVKAPDAIVGSGPNIFLAGSIDQGQAEDWQERITEKLFHSGIECTILNPRRENWDSTWEQSKDNQEFLDQVNWEYMALKRSLVVMYFSESSKAPISFLELGLALEGNRPTIVFCPKGFYRKGNIDITCARYEVPVYETEDEFIAAIVSHVKPEIGLTIPTAVIEKASKTEGRTNMEKMTENIQPEPVIPNITVFKIKDTNTGMFSTGGYQPRWTTKGKTWNSIGFVKSSLKQHIVDREYAKEWKNNIPKSWVVVEISSVNGLKEYSARNLYPLTNPYIKFSGEHLLAELGRI